MEKNEGNCGSNPDKTGPRRKGKLTISTNIRMEEVGSASHTCPGSMRLLESVGRQISDISKEAQR
jgi:hypothetical protein